MNRKETLEVVNQILDESYKAMKEGAERLVNAREWDFNQFGDRNTFARAVATVLLQEEIRQYEPINIEPKSATKRKYNQLARNLNYELCCRFVKKKFPKEV